MFTIVFFTELSALLAAIFLCRQKGSTLALFVPFLVLTIVVEIIAYYVGYVRHIPNYFIYNIYVPLSMIFYAYIIGKGVSSRPYRLAIFYLVSCVLLFCIVNIIAIQDFFVFNTYSVTAVSFCLNVCCLVYLLDVIKRPDADVSPLSDPLFWIIAGLVFFHLGGILLNLLYTYSVKEKMKINGKTIYSFINQFLNLLMYGCFVVGFYICYRRKKFIS